MHILKKNISSQHLCWNENIYFCIKLDACLGYNSFYKLKIHGLEFLTFYCRTKPKILLIFYTYIIFILLALNCFLNKVIFLNFWFHIRFYKIWNTLSKDFYLILLIQNICWLYIFFPHILAPIKLINGLFTHYTVCFFY